MSRWSLTIPFQSSLKTDRGRRVALGTLSAVCAKLLVAAANFLVLPLAVQYLGRERYGVWVTVTTTTAWITLLEFGVASTLTNNVSDAFARGEREIAAQQTANALAITSTLAIVIGVCVLLAWPYVDWMHFFGVSSLVSASDVKHTVAIAICLALVTPTCTLGAKVLAGYQEVHISNAVVALGSLGMLVGMYFGVRSHLSMPMLFVCTSGVVTGASLIALLITLFLYKPWLRPRLSYLDVMSARKLLSSGSAFFLIQIAGIVVFSTDNIVVGHILGAVEVTTYSTAMRLAFYAQLLPGFMFPSLWPAYAEANARGDYIWIRSMFRKAMSYTLISLAVPLTIFVLFGQSFIAWWIGPAARPTRVLLIALSVWTIIASASSMAACLLNAVGRTRLLATLSMMAAGLNLAISIFLVRRIGSVGAVIGTISSYIVVLIVPQMFEVASYFREARKAVPVAERSVGLDRPSVHYVRE